MKNYEKFKATEDAMDAYNMYSMSCSDIGCNSVGMVHSRCCREEHNLLDAAKHVLSNLSEANLESLRIAVKNEMVIGKTNFSRYDDADSAVEAFMEKCDNDDCSECKHCKFRESKNCIVAWLYSKDMELFE